MLSFVTVEMYTAAILTKKDDKDDKIFYMFSTLQVKNTKCIKIKRIDNFFRYDLLKKSWCF